MARGEGAVVEDVDGNVYLDCCAGIAVAATGHSHPDVVSAIVEQAKRFLHTSTDYYHETQVALGEAIADSGAYSLVGGGDTAAAVEQMGLQGRFSHVSTGGGATLEYLEGRELPGVAVLKEGS